MRVMKGEMVQQPACEYRGRGEIRCDYSTDRLALLALPKGDRNNTNLLVWLSPHCAMNLKVKCIPYSLK